MFGSKPVAFFILASLLLCQGRKDDDAVINSGSHQSAPQQANKKILTEKTMSDGMIGKQSADRETILAFKKLKGEELRKQYGAHSLGIGWQRVDGKKTDKLALIFYVVSATEEPAVSIPASFEFFTEGDKLPVSIPTSLVENAAPREE